MKKYCYLLALAILFALAVIPSCKKEPPLRVETNTQSPDPALLQQAQEWYRQQLVLPSSTAEGAINLKAYTPDWGKAKVVKNSKGQNVVGVPLYSSKGVYLELNILFADGKSVGIIKKYVLGQDKKIELSIYKAPGDLIVKGYYDKERGLFMAGSPKDRLMMDPPIPSDDEDGGPGGGGERPINANKPINMPEVVIRGEPVNKPSNPYSFPSHPVGEPHFGDSGPGNHNGYGHHEHGGGGGTATSTSNNDIGSGFDVNNVYNGNGQRPLSESPDRCQGAQDIWNTSTSNNKEVVGLLTSDGKVIVVAILGYSGGTWGGLYRHEGIVYYTYPASQGAPSQSYAGMQIAAKQYFIPIVATIHTHSPCIQTGGNGITDMKLSQGDQDLAQNFQSINHYIIGCGAVGTFDHYSDSPAVLQSGHLSTTCNRIK